VPGTGSYSIALAELVAVADVADMFISDRPHDPDRALNHARAEISPGQGVVLILGLWMFSRRFRIETNYEACAGKYTFSHRTAAIRKGTPLRAPFPCTAKRSSYLPMYPRSLPTPVAKSHPRLAVKLPAVPERMSR
jgi:hypothetical protein